MSDSDSIVSKLNGSSGFISYEESKSEGWSSENSVDYALQNKRNNKRLQKRRNQPSAYNRIFENVLRAENHVMLGRTPPHGEESESTANQPVSQSSDEDTPRLRAWGSVPLGASTPQNNVTLAGSRTAFSDEALRTVNYYKKFGDFWNVFPKTDYVYSRHSKWYGSEVAPGIPRIPNMCRPTYRGRYGNTFSSHLEQNTSYSEYEETWFVRIRRIVRKSVTTTVTTFFKVAKTAASPAVTAVSAVASAASSAASATSSATATVLSAAATVSSAASTVSSWIPEVSSSLSSAFTARSSDEENPSSGKPWSLLFLLLLLLVPVIYIAFNGIDPPPPYVPSFIEDISQDSLYSTVKRLYSPFGSLWGGTRWLSSLLVNSLLMIPTLLIETSSILYGFFQYYATSTFDQYSVPAYTPLSASTTGSSITPEELNNLKLWVSEMMSTRMRELKEELAAGRRQPDSQKDILEALVLIQNSIKKLEESDKLIQNSVMKLEESDKLILNNIEKLEGTNKFDHQRLGELEEGYTENQVKIKEMETLSTENQMKLQMLLKKSESVKEEQTSAFGATVISAEIRDDVISIVERLLEGYHADRTGKPDYALGSNGAAIASIRCTRPFNKRSAEYVLWGILRWDHINTPDIIIKPGFMPGECWAFEGANGYVAIQLSMPIFVSGFALEHTPKELTPFGHIESAPRKFSVWGLSSLEDEEEEFLGRFEFEDNGKSLQSFEAVVIDKPFHLVELRIESNHGHLEYTCLYRFRVHGRPAI